MLGLRTQEGERFERFFKLVQEEAERQGCVFFMDAGDGRDFETATMEGEDLTGFLIPAFQADAFNSRFQADLGFPHNAPEWADFFRFATWKQDGDKITIQFTA